MEKDREYFVVFKGCYKTGSSILGNAKFESSNSLEYENISNMESRLAERFGFDEVFILNIQKLPI